MYEEQIKRGVALLDEARPGWREYVAVERLDVARADQCVLGQVFGSYQAGAYILGLSSTVAKAGHGFTVGSSGTTPYHQQYAVLTAEWVQEIENYVNEKEKV